MGALVVGDSSSDSYGITARVCVGGREFTISYRVPLPVSDSATADALVAACLLPAMRAADTLRIDRPVSQRLLGAIPTIQNVVTSWRHRFPIYDRYNRVSVQAPSRAPHEHGEQRGVAAFFAGGVDSFYTLVRHRPEIDTLVLVRGFDFDRDGAVSDRITGALRTAAAELGKPLLEISTDLRRFSDRFAFWESYHGSALASVALLLGSAYRKVYVPATQTYAHLAPLGSHPLLDPLWSTDEVEIVHDVCEADRLEKLELISTEPAARRWLRVCWENRNGRYNCGSCEKCLRTMLALTALGRLGSFETLPDLLDPRAVSRVDLPELRHTWEASLALLQRSPDNAELAAAVHRHMYTARARVVRRIHHYRRRALGLIGL